MPLFIVLEEREVDLLIEQLKAEHSAWQADECSDDLRRESAERIAKEFPKLIATIERLQCDRNTAIEAASGGVGWWVWQGDGEDHVQSLTCPILIRADQMRAIIEENDRLRRVITNIQEMASTELDEDPPGNSMIWQIEADSRAALKLCR